MKKLIFYFMLPLAIVLLCSCASSDRMMFCSPLFSPVTAIPVKETVDGLDSGGFRQGRRNISENVNIWPLYYDRGDVISILWPIFDYDQYGMAARPLFNKHKNEYSILFPLCAWNPKHGDGWAVNFNWDKKGYGLFPVAYFGDDSWYVFPIWKKKNRFGLVPFWYDTENKEGGLFPVIYYHRDEEGWIFPLYYYSNDAKSSLTGAFFPLTGYRYSHTDEEDYSHWIIPFYIYTHNSAYKKILTPFYIDSKDLFWCPLYSKSDNWYGVLSSVFWRKDRNEVFILPLLSHWENNDAKLELNLAWPLYHSDYNKKLKHFESFTLWPLLNINTDMPGAIIEINKDEYSVFGPVIYKHEINERWSSWGQRPFGRTEIKTLGIQKKVSEKNSTLLFCESEYLWDSSILPLNKNKRKYAREKNSELDPEETEYQVSHFYLLYYLQSRIYKKWDFDKISKEQIREMYITLYKLKRKYDVSEAVRKKNKENDKQLLEDKLRRQLENMGIICKSNQLLDLLNGLTELDKQYSKQLNAGRFDLPLLYHFSFDDDHWKWNMLLWLIQSEYNQQTESGEFNVLKFLYRHEYVKDQYSIDAFPFINITNTDKLESISLLWRLFRLETLKSEDGEKTKLYLFFISCGEW